MEQEATTGLRLTSAWVKHLDNIMLVAVRRGVRLAVTASSSMKLSSANAACSPRRAVCRRSVIIVVITVLDPLPDIAVHVMEAELVGSE